MWSEACDLSLSTTNALHGETSLVFYYFAMQVGEIIIFFK
jgi:hypothetical protein